MSVCRVFSCVVQRGCLLWPVHSLGKTLLAFALLHSVLQGQICLFSSVQFSHSVMSDSLRPHEPQHARPPCPSPTPRVHSNPCLSSWRCHPTIPSSVIPFSSCLNLSQHQGLFPLVSFSHQVAKVLEFQLQHQSFQWIQDWFSLGWTGWISLQSKGLSRVFSNTTVQKHQFFCTQLSFIVQLSHPDMITGKNIALIRQTFVGKVMSLLFNILSRFIIAFFPKSKHFLI